MRLIYQDDGFLLGSKFLDYLLPCYPLHIIVQVPLCFAMVAHVAVFGALEQHIANLYGGKEYNQAF